MKLDEKETLLQLFNDEHAWCQHAEARDSVGNPVQYDDTSAVSWDLVGGMCHAFGWERACKLFVEMWNFDFSSSQRYWSPQDKAINAMVKMIDFNDHVGTSFEEVIGKISAVKPWRESGV